VLTVQGSHIYFKWALNSGAGTDVKFGFAEDLPSSSAFREWLWRGHRVGVLALRAPS
jgi:hypothetical protein